MVLDIDANIKEILGCAYPNEETVGHLVEKVLK
jgi:hypothetical protein